MSPTRTRLVRSGSLTIALALALSVLAGVLALPARAAEPVKMVFTLDSSGSMKEKTSTGEVKSAAAKEALTEVSRQIPSSFSVGLRVFGSKVFSRDDKGSCTDSELLVPVKANNTRAIRDAMKNYKPFGETPISYALQQSAKDLGGDGKRTIVLVSDGESTCDPDPCEVAGDLVKGTQDLQIDVVGFSVSGKAKDQLKCVASRGKGTYYDATDAKTLANSLQTLQDRAAKSFQVSGTPVQGGTTAEQATPITAGDWNDELPATGTNDVRYYKVYRKILGSTLHLSASLNRLGRADAVAVAVTTPDGTSCGTASDFRADDFGSSILSAAVSAGAQTGKPAVKACADSNELLLAVRRADVVEGSPRYSGQQTVPVELRVLEEKPVPSTSGLPAARKAPDFRPQFGDNPDTVTPGASFADAPTVKAGTYTANIVPGETQVFAVPQTWGQHLNATLSFDKPSSTLGKQIGTQQVKADIKVFSPNRGPGSTTLGGGENFLPSDTDLVLGAASTPVTYLNRAQDPTKATAYLPGQYTVVVSLGADPQEQSYVVPYRLSVQIDGDKDGAPNYAAPTPAPEPPSPNPVPTATPGATGGEGAAGGVPIAAIGAGVAILGALGVAAAWLVSRRRRAAGGGDPAP